MDKFKKIIKSKKTVTGLPKDEIDTRPTVSEAKLTSAVITFGRMNPPTTGHLFLVDKILKVAREKSGTPLIFLSHSQDAKKNPLSYDEKLKLAQAAFGQRLVVRSESRNIIDVLKELQSRFNSVTVVVGSDRVPEFERILKTYNNKEFKFKSVNVVSAGTRDPDADDISGMSASKMRKLASENKLNQFKQGLPPTLHSMANMIMAMVRSGMGLKAVQEQVTKMDEQNTDLKKLEEVLTLQARRKKAMVARRNKGRLKIARARAQRRMAATGSLKKRAGRAAVRLIKRRVAGMRGLKYSQLSPAEKSIIDKKVAMRKTIIKRLAQRLMPRVRKAELQRFKKFRTRNTRKENINFSFERMLLEQNTTVNLNSVNEVAIIVDKFLQTIEQNNNITEKGFSNLVHKSSETGIPMDFILKAYNEGYNDPREGHTPEQSGFIAVNKFINEKRGLWDNIHAKRARIKAGSGESMRKPGAEGAPTAADFKRAAESVEEAKADKGFMPTPRQVPAPPGGHPVPPGYERVKSWGGASVLRKKPKAEEVDLKKKAEEEHPNDKEFKKNQRILKLINNEFNSFTNTEPLHELFFKVEIASLPAMYINSSSEMKIKTELRKLLKKPEEQVINIQRVMPDDIRKAFRERLKGKLADHANDTDDMEEQLQRLIDEAALMGTNELVSMYRRATPGQVLNTKKGTNQHALKVEPVVDGTPNNEGVLQKPKL